MSKNFQLFFILNAVIGSLLCGSATAAPLPLTVIYSFPNGLAPDAGLVIGTNGSFYGVTSTGGPHTNGGIFEVTSNGVLTNLIWLDETNGSMPLGSLTPDKSGNFYGTASGGGVKNNGTIFELTAGGTFKLLASFNKTNGSTPMGPLLAGTNGWYYGTTFNGGSNGLGAIFRVSPAGVLSNVWSFDSANGANPASGLIQGANGQLYGTTEYGGSNGLGTIFEFTYSNTLTTLYSFSNTTGSFPGGLAMDTSGNFYGSTISGGHSFAGTIFKLAASGGFKTLVAFGVTNGDEPNSPLSAGGAGNWYGTTQLGGAFGQGTIFALGSKGLLTNLVSFDETNGAQPRSGMILGPDGNFYGTTSLGGSNGGGVIYQLSGFPPYIIQPPATQKYASNRTAVFSVAAGGSGPLSYQWLFDGTNAIPGATDASLVLANEKLSNGGTYTVLISNAFGTASTDAVLSVVAPSVTLVPPSATVTNSPLTLSGKASGPNGVSVVLCQLNAGGWAPAEGTLAWQTNLTLQPGTNVFQVQSFDPAGNPSTIKSATFFYASYSPLTLLTNGLGSISTDFTGTNLIVGRSYTLRARPGNGWLFFDWTGTLTATHNPLTFVMQSNMVLAANFVTNSFIAGSGAYEGLFFTSNAVAEQSAGLVSSLIVKSNGAYSGQLLVKGIRHGFGGVFDLSQESFPTVARSAAQGGPIMLELALSTNGVTGTISGTNEGGWTSSLVAERVGKSAGSGEYTMLMAPDFGAASASPPGYGYALVTNHNGSVTLTGALADGAAFSQTAPLTVEGDVPFYASLYGNTGLVLGWLNLGEGLTATNLCWIKAATNGFTNMITNILTSAWTKPPADFLPFGVLLISNTGPALNFIVAITNNTLLKEMGSPTNSLTGSLNTKTGLLKITFGNGDGKDTTTGYAAFLSSSTKAGGYFVTKTNAGSISLGP